MTEKQVFKLCRSYGNFSINGAMKYFCGERLAWGSTRTVYALKQDPDNYVVKLQHDFSFDNIMEWKIWEEVMHCDELAKWFAPCIGINSVGTVLFQQRAEFRRRKDYPKHIPSFFTDLKIQNFGFIKDQLVCVDYGCIMLSHNLDYKKMKCAKWWNVNYRLKKPKRRR